jgi:midasin
MREATVSTFFCVFYFKRDEAKSQEEEMAAEKAWRVLESEIGPLAQSLCEQLRLILEPSLAARLQGDFRSGKRLNMRKVPYIGPKSPPSVYFLNRPQIFDHFHYYL